MAGLYNNLVAAQGQPIRLGLQGGTLLLNPPAQIAGQMTRTDLENRIWHLLREPGPDTGYLPPQVGEFAQSVVDRDLNICLAQFISAAGLPPKVSDRQVTVPVLPCLDFPVPPDLQAMYGVEYTPAGQQTFPLIGKNFDEFKAFWASDTLAAGQPQVYRQMFAGYIRLYPQPGPGQAYGPGIGTVTFNGVPTPGIGVQLTITNNPSPSIVLPPYIVPLGATLESVAQGVANLVANSNACIGPAAFLEPPSTAANSFQLTAINAPGSNISYLVTVSSGALLVTPVGAAFLQPNGDTMTFYYSSTGTVMLYAGDTPGIPPQFHMALAYGVLADYWNRKDDPAGNAKHYFDRFNMAVTEAKKLEWDSERGVNPSIGNYDESDVWGAVW